MRKVIYSMTTSLDGYIAGPDGAIDLVGARRGAALVPQRTDRGSSGAHLLGRRLYETMVYWETADQDPAAHEVTVDFARIWQALPKIVFSTTLEAVEGNTRLVPDGVAEEVARLKEQDGRPSGRGRRRPGRRRSRSAA